MATAEHLDRDEQRLAELGYTQRLNRGWSSFQNFAISFTIISVFAGTFTTYGQAWNYGGPIAISIGWPVICGLILLVAFSMSELASKYPTAGGIYYWASDLGGRTWGWFTGWFNFFGLVGIVASVVYGSATFLTTLLGLYKVNVFGMNFGDDKHFLAEAFVVFVVLLGIHALINIYSSQLVAALNNVTRPYELRPPVFEMPSTSDFSGSVRVISSKSDQVAKRRPGLVGLCFLRGITHRSLRRARSSRPHAAGRLPSSTRGCDRRSCRGASAWSGR